jgi:hypothetical protein
MNITEQDKIWLACFIDCEGSISLAKSGKLKGNPSRPSDGRVRYCMKISIANTDIRMIKKAEKILGNLPSINRADMGNKKKNPKHKVCYRLIIGRNGTASEMLEAVLPYLIIKKEIARRCLEWMEFTQKRKYYSPLQRSKTRNEYDKMAEYVRKANSRYGLVVAGA